MREDQETDGGTYLPYRILGTGRLGWNKVAEAKLRFPRRTILI